MSDASENSVLIIAAENSAAQYAVQILSHLESEPLHFFGVGDGAMEALGFHAVAGPDTMAVMGFQEVISQYKDIRKVFFQILKEVDQKKPKVALLIDYPGFNLRLAAELKSRGVYVLYFVSPQVWAWKKNRIKKIRASVDEMLVLFPFEVDFYQKEGVSVEFVGHPLVSDIPDIYFSSEEKDFQRSRYGFRSTDFVLGFMPGSRTKELKHNLPTQIDVARKLCAKYPQTRAVFLIAPTFTKEDLLPYFENVGFSYVLVKDDPYRMIRLIDLMLVTSGTATLQVAMLAVPMVIMYKVNSWTAALGRMLVGGRLPVFGLPNIISGKSIVVERFQNQASVKRLTMDLEKLYLDANLRQKQQEELKSLNALFSQRNPAKRVAARIKELTQC